MSLQPVGIITNLFPFVCVDPLKAQHPHSFRRFSGGNESSELLTRSVAAPPPPELQVSMQEVPGLPASTLCAQRPPGGPRCPPGLAPNSTGLLGRALGLMNSSASWRPLVEGQRPPGEDGWTGGWRWRKRRKSRAGFTVLIPQMVEMTS